MAVEIFHNFSLVHDDIMDAAPLRRGKPTVHHKYNLNAGILSGDVMLVKAYEFLLQTDSPFVAELTRIFTKMAIQVCEGQQMDMDFETQANVSIEDYLKMIELKTAVLLGCAIELGALIGGASKKDAELLFDFGRNLGIAFQLQDDLLDAFGDPKKVGKKWGGDIVQNKKTYLYLKALELAPKEIADKLALLYNVDTEKESNKINVVLEIFGQLGIKSLTEQQKEVYWLKSLKSLEAVNADPSRKRLLENFAIALMNRDF